MTNLLNCSTIGFQLTTQNGKDRNAIVLDYHGADVTQLPASDFRTQGRTVWISFACHA